MPEIDEKFIWGIAGFVIGAFFGSFISEIGKDAYGAVKRWLKFKFKSEHEVERDFKSQIYKPQNYTWVPEENLKNKEKHKWMYHPHPKYGGKCIHVSGTDKFPKKEYLMVAPNATKS